MVIDSPSPQRFVYGGTDKNGSGTPLNSATNASDNFSPFRFGVSNERTDGARWASDMNVGGSGNTAGLRRRNNDTVPSQPPPPRASLMTMQNHSVPMSSSSHAANNVVDDDPVLIPEDSSVSRNGDDLSRWVVLVHGSDDLDDRIQLSLQRRFESYGTILRNHTAAATDNNARSGNWICFQYKSRSEAEKALCQDLTFHGGADSMLLSLKRLDCGTAKRLGIHIDDSLDSSSGPGLFSPGVPSPRSLYQDRAITTVDDESILLGDDASNTYSSRRNIKEGFCYKVLAWVFMWN